MKSPLPILALVALTLAAFSIVLLIGIEAFRRRSLKRAGQE